MHLKKHIKHKLQRGQGMTEYVVVLVALIGLGATVDLKGALESLHDGINSKNKGFSYAISLSDFPDSEKLSDLSPEAQDKLTKLQETFDKMDELL